MSSRAEKLISCVKSTIKQLAHYIFFRVLMFERRGDMLISKVYVGCCESSCAQYEFEHVDLNTI
jgi:hypothetical protein